MIVSRRRQGLAALLACSALLGVAVLAGCGGGSEEPAETPAATTEAPASEPAATEAATTEASTEAAPAEDVTLAYLASSSLNQFSASMIDELTKATDTAGVTLEVFDPNFDPQKQFSQCQDVVTSGKFNAIIIQPIDQVGIVPCIEDAIAQGIYVVTSENPVGPKGDTSDPQVEGMVGSVFTPHTSEGQALADMTIAACADLDPCNVGFYFGFRNFAYDVGRYDVFKQLIADHPNIKIVFEAETKFDLDEGYKATQDLLQAHPDINVLVVNSDTASTGALNALTDAGVEGVEIIGSGASVEGVQAVKDGSFYGTTVLMPRSSIYAAFEMIMQAAAGEPVADNSLSDQQDLSPVGSYITVDNAGDFVGEWSFLGNPSFRQGTSG